ncbi:RelA/SpoT family protein, partial [Roseateles sp. GG27B]
LVSRIERDVQKAFGETELKVEIEGREKTLYSIYQKMRDKHLSFAQVSDIFGFRIVVADLPHCYLSLGVLHQLYKPQ